MVKYKWVNPKQNPLIGCLKAAVFFWRQQAEMIPNLCMSSSWTHIWFLCKKTPLQGSFCNNNHRNNHHHHHQILHTEQQKYFWLFYHTFPKACVSFSINRCSIAFFLIPKLDLLLRLSSPQSTIQKSFPLLREGWLDGSDLDAACSYGLAVSFPTSTTCFMESFLVRKPGNNGNSWCGSKEVFFSDMPPYFL